MAARGARSAPRRISSSRKGKALSWHKPRRQRDQIGRGCVARGPEHRRDVLVPGGGARHNLVGANIDCALVNTPSRVEIKSGDIPARWSLPGSG